MKTFEKGNLTSFKSRGILALLMLVTAACNTNDRGGLKVAGGTIDGSEGSVKFPATVYVEMNGKDFNGNAKVIRNVGNFVDVGVASQLGLVLSLADVFDTSSNLPLFKTVDLTIYLSNGQDSIVLPGLSFQNDGSMLDGKGNKYIMVSVGLKAEKVGKSDIPDDKARSVMQKLFVESPLVTDKGLNVRDPQTSFQMISIPRAAHASLASLKAPKIVPAESRPVESALSNLKMVGFGENIVGGERKSDFALSASLPAVMKRNYADVNPLNMSSTDVTPLRKMLANTPAAVQQIWEVSGSGLCGSKDGSNYDTGAGVYIGTDQFVGFAVVSSAKSSGYKGKLDCAATGRDDMATVIVSPNSEVIAKFVSLIPGK